MSLTTLTLTGTLPGAGGALGVFTPSGWEDDPTDQEIIPPEPVSVTLSGAGKFSAALLPNDAPGPLPTGWSWQAEFEGVTGVQPYSFSFQVFAGPFSFTASNGSPCVITATAPGGQPWSAGMQVALSGGSLPAGIPAGTYYIVNPAVGTFEVATTPGGTALASTSTGSGQVTVTQVDLSTVSQVVSTAPMAAYAQLGGDLTGTPAQVAKIQGTPIAAFPGGSTEFLRGDGTFAIPPGGTPSGPAGGDLSGNYPNPGVAKSGGVAFGSAAFQPSSAFDASGAAAAAQAAAIAASLPTLTEVSVSASGTLALDKVTEVTATSGLVTMTLPASVANSLIVCERASASTQNVAVTGNIRGVASTTITLQLANESEAFFGDGTTWWPVAGHKTLASLQALFAQVANNLSDLGSASAARGNLGLGSAATQPTSAFDAAGAAAAAAAASLPLAGGTMSGAIAMGSHKVTGLTNGSASSDAAAFGQIPTSASQIGGVTSVAAGDTSIVVGGTAAAPTIETGTLDVIAADHPPAAAVGMNGKTLTNTGAAGVTLPWFAGTFGDGSDGSVTFDGTTTILGIVPAANTYLLTRDIFCTSITINNGVTVQTGSCRIFCRGTVTNNGTIDNSGKAATNKNGAATTNGNNGAFRAGQTGGSGQTTSGNAGGSGNTSFGIGTAGAGGNGTSGNNGGAAGTTNAQSASTWMYRSGIATPIMGNTGGANTPIGGASGGGGGGGDGTNFGGGGGGGGGFILIVAWALVNNGVIQAPGGSGFTPTVGNCGGGGPGAGGVILTYTLTAPTGSGSTNVAAGSPGSGFGTGAAGGSGTAGTVMNLLVT